MKKVLAIVIGVVLVLGMCSAMAEGNMIYFLTPTATHGWMGQLGAFAAQKVSEINEAGVYRAYQYTADAGSIQNDQIDEILANGDAAGVVICGFPHGEVNIVQGLSSTELFGDTFHFQYIHCLPHLIWFSDRIALSENHMDLGCPLQILLPPVSCRGR